MTRDYEYSDMRETPHLPFQCYIFTCGGDSYDPCRKALETEQEKEAYADAICSDNEDEALRYTYIDTKEN